MISFALGQKLISLFGVADPEQSRLEREHNLILQDTMLRDYYDQYKKDCHTRALRNGLMDLSDRYATEPAEIVLYGASRDLMYILRQVKYLGLKPDFLCDRDSSKAAQNPFGLKAITLDELIAGHAGSYLLATTIHLHTYADMYGSLVSLGFPPSRIYSALTDGER